MDLSKLIAAGSEVAYIQKDSRNAHFDYKYLSELAVKEHGWAALRRNGFALVKCEIEILFVDTDGRNMVARARLTVQGEGGVTAVWEGIGQGADKGDKAAMKAQTAAVREALKNGLGIASGDDPEKDTTVDQDAVNKLIAAITGADTMDVLNALKADVKALGVGSPAYIKVASVYKQQKGKLENG